MNEYCDKLLELNNLQAEAIVYMRQLLQQKYNIDKAEATDLVIKYLGPGLRQMICITVCPARSDCAIALKLIACTSSADPHI